MAKLPDCITIGVKMEIPPETICRCLRILEMWMDDNPYKAIIVDREFCTDGYHHKIHIESDGAEQK